MELKSLTQWIKCVESKSGSLRMFLESLGYSSMHLGVSFIALRPLGAVGDQLRKQFLPSVEWCTGQFGAPPDNHCSCPVRDLLPNQAHLTVAPPGPLAHRALSGAHQTVRCSSWSLEQSTCRPQIARPTVSAGDPWLTGQSGAPPDSPVNYNHVADDSPDSPVHHWTVRWIIAVQLRLFSRPATSPLTSLAHRTLSGAPPDSPVCQARADTWLLTAKSFPMLFFFCWPCF
jgi:hypothetical protein